MQIPTVGCGGSIATCRRAIVAMLLGSAMLAGCSADRIAGPKLPDAPIVSVAIAAGSEFTCALTVEGRAYCWGDNSTGEIGDSTFIPHLTPSATLTTHTFVAIYAGNTTACALDHAGVAWCWGDDPSQPGVRLSFLYTPHPVHAPAAFRSLTVGRKFACGLDGSGNAYCWGENGFGQLGVGDTLTHAAPTRVVGGLHFATIAAGFFSTCAVTTGGDGYCWGNGTFGELGTGDTLSASQPTRVAGNHQFASLSGGAIHQCGITVDGTALCWGTNSSGQLGDGSGEARLTPTPVVGGLHFTALRSHRANSIFGSTCGLTAAGDVYCWGWNANGQLGVDIASTSDPCTTIQPQGTNNVPGVVTDVCSFRPIKVPGIANAVAIDAGMSHSCALTAAAELLCWGQNRSGELGDGSGLDHTTPVSPAGGLHFP